MSLPIDPITLAPAVYKQVKENIGPIQKIFEWFKKKRYPKAPRNSTGIAIGILTDSVNKEQLNNDFIKTIEQLLKQSKSQKKFHIIDLPNHHAEKITDFETAKKVITKCRCKFGIWGLVRKRNIKKESFFVLDINSIVIHNHVALEISNALGDEMGRLIPNRSIISADNDLVEFELTATTMGLSAKYFLGIASYLSDDVEYSIELLKELRQEIPRINRDILPSEVKNSIEIMRRSININLGVIYFNLAGNSHNKWRRTRSNEDLESMISYVKQAEEYLPKTNKGACLWSIFHFVKEGDLKTAKKTLQPCKTEKDSTLLFNLAFLFAYEGNLKEANKLYRAAFNLELESKALLEIEEFILWVLDEKPDKTQLYFCLGLLNYFGKKDYKNAREDFDKFINSENTNKYLKEIEQARKLIDKKV